MGLAVILLPPPSRLRMWELRLTFNKQNNDDENFKDG